MMALFHLHILFWSPFLSGLGFLFLLFFFGFLVVLRTEYVGVKVELGLLNAVVLCVVCNVVFSVLSVVFVVDEIVVPGLGVHLGGQVEGIVCSVGTVVVSNVVVVGSKVVVVSVVVITGSEIRLLY